LLILYDIYTDAEPAGSSRPVSARPAGSSRGYSHPMSAGRGKRAAGLWGGRPAGGLLDAEREGAWSLRRGWTGVVRPPS